MRRALLAVAITLGGLFAFDYGMPHTSARALAQLERWRSGLQLDRATVGGLEFAYLHGGSGEPLILLHGFGADKDNFTRVARHLTPHVRVLVPDLPGFGESSKPAELSYTVPEQVERVRAFTQSRGLQRFHLGGSSMGGFIALAYAAKYPDEVASLWLLAPAGTAAAFDSEVRRIARETGVSPLTARTPEEHARVREFAMARPPWLPYSIRRVLAERAAANFELHARIAQEITEPRSPLIETYVERLDVPALIVWGTADRALNPRGADTLKRLMPGSEVVLMEGIGHLPMVEATRRTAQDYLDFRRRRTAP